MRLDHGGEIDLPGGPDAALLLHGLTGSTYEVHPLADRFHAAGLRVLAPVMAGHEGSPRALRGLSSSAWVEKAEQDLDRIRGARRTFLAGVSMGGMVACALARRHPDRVQGLLLFAPALRLAPIVKLGALLGKIPGLRDLIVSKGGTDLRDPEMRRQRAGGLPGLPLSAIAELDRLSRLVERQLPGITAPTLVMAGERDRTVTVGGARRVVARLGGGAELVLVPNSGHLLLVDVDRGRCVDRAMEFVQLLRAPYAADIRPLTDDEHQRRR